MRVLKFGGTSVGSAENIERVSKVLLDYKDQGVSFCVVVSAMSGVTNQLVELGRLAFQGDNLYLDQLETLKTKHLETTQELGVHSDLIEEKINRLFIDLKDILHGVYLLHELSKRSNDAILSFGELLSSLIIGEFLTKKGLESVVLDTRKVIKTDSSFGNANVQFDSTDQNIVDCFKSSTATQIITGFIGSNENQVTTTLGRGGSDYTASIFGAAIGADEIEIWTDVDGVMTADPKKVKAAYSMGCLSYDEAMEISHFGAKVIYPPTLKPAIHKKIPLRIRNTFNSSFPGTLINEEGAPSKYPVKGISSIEKISLANLTGTGLAGVPGIASRLFGSLAENNISVVLITQASSEHSITFAVNPVDSRLSKEVLEKEFAREIAHGDVDEVDVNDQLGVIAIIGENMQRTPGISGKLFMALGKNGINVHAIAQGSSELNVSVVIDRSDISKALNALHEAFFLSDQKSLNIFLIGAGLIGSTLMRQIKEQEDYLLDEKSLKINVVGIANSRNMHFDESGIDLNKWRELIDFPGNNSGVKAFIDQMKTLNLSNSVFVDCTSNEEVTQYYHQILESSISIVTPNKLANSGKFIDYAKLRKAASQHGVKFLYETNVGAGLPIINTLSDLKFSGDKILKIEGVLSGTLSYIFNNFVPGTRFSDIVKDAKAKGFTEPDPRDDLNGMDVCRKILILAREAGYDLEPEDIELESFLPSSCFDVDTVDDFFTELEKEDDKLSEVQRQATNENKVLRFIASLVDGKATVKLEAVDTDHPFYSMSGSDNVVSFTTKRYFERQLVVKGPGAGAEVTSAGVFAEIISISNHFIQDNYKLAGGYGR